VSTGSALSLEVNKNTGSVRLRNNTATNFILDFYRITSDQDALAPTTWNSLDGQNIGALDGPDDGAIAGDSATEGWARGAQSDSSQLLEFFLGASGSVLAANQAYNLGAAFDTSVLGVGVDGDLEATVGLVGGAQLPIDVVYVTAASPGDFDNNGRVDGNDFLYWQTHPPVTSMGLAAWRDGYGLAVAAGTPIPEPGALKLLLAGSAGAILLLRRLGQLNTLAA
jgi:hypothetical protein